MSHYIFQKEDNSNIKFGIVKKPPENVVDHVPAGIYAPHYEPTPFGPQLTGLEYIDDSFKMESEVRYGVFNDVKNTILKEFKDKKVGSTSVLAIGNPGTGKSLMGKDLANYCIRLGMPVLFIRQNYPISDIGRIAKIISPCMVFMDEFGKFFSTAKTYLDGDQGRSTQEHGHLLSLLDDRSLSNVLFFLSSNSDDKSNELGIVNRPGRVQFNLNMDYLEASSIIDCISHSSMTPAMKEVVCMNAFDSDLNAVTDGWSTDIVNYISQYLNKDLTQTELNTFSAIRNVPNIFPKVMTVWVGPSTIDKFEAMNPEFKTDSIKRIVITKQTGQLLASVIFNNGKSTEYRCIYDIFEVIKNGMNWDKKDSKSCEGFELVFSAIKANSKHKEFRVNFKCITASRSARNFVGDIIDFERHREKMERALIKTGLKEEKESNITDSCITDPVISASQGIERGNRGVYYTPF